jgi:LCP family protein required for cell wall assembly
MSHQARSNRGTTTALIAGLVVLAVIVAVLAFIALNQSPAAPAEQLSASASVPEPSATLNADLLDNRLTVLVVGTDVNASRAAAGEAANTDSLIVASIGADQSKMTLVSLPRDTTDIPMPDGSTWQRKVNAIEAETNVTTLVGAISTLFDVPIDHYVQVDMDDLVALVDAVGGVDVNPDKPLADPKVQLDIPAGPQTLDGAHALAYSRTRVDTDYGRAARQQEVLLDLVSKLVDPKADVDLSSLLDGLHSLKTDLPLDDLPTLVEIARRAQSAEVTRQVLEPPEFITFEGDRGDGRGYILEPDIDAIRRFAQQHVGSE